MDAELLEELRKTLEVITNDAKTTKHVVQSLLDKIQNQPSTTNGLSFLDVKNQLLLQYLISLAGITALKSTGKSIQGSIFLDQAIDMRVYLEKLRPIDQKLKYQIDKLVKVGVDQEKSKLEKNPLHHKANLDNFMSTGKEGEGSSDGGDDSDLDDDDDDIVQKPAGQPKSSDGVYRPPKVTPQFFDEEPKSQEKVEKKKLMNRALIQELQEEFLETPAEIHNMGDAYAKKLSLEVKEKQRFEETYMTRLPMTKRDKHRSKSMGTMGVLGDEITDFSSKRPTPSSSSAKKGKGKKRKSSKGGGKKSTKKFRKSH